MSNQQNKLYLGNYPIHKINNSLLETLEEYYKKTSTEITLYSDEGIYKCNDKGYINKLIPIDKPPIHTQLGKYDMIVDSSYFEKREVYSHIPADHVCIETSLFHYCIGEKSDLYFIVEGTYQHSKVSMNTTSLVINNKYHNFIPSDFYFYTNVIEPLDNIFIKKELNMFISVLY